MPKRCKQYILKNLLEDKVQEQNCRRRSVPELQERNCFPSD